MACLWIHDAGSSAHTQRVLPDACVDIVWNGRRLVVGGPRHRAGADHRARGRGSGRRALPRRRRRGRAGLPAAGLLDTTVPLEDVWGSESERVAERVAAAGAPAAQLATLAREVGERIARHDEPDAVVRAAATGIAGTALGMATASSGAASPTRSAMARRRSSASCASSDSFPSRRATRRPTSPWLALDAGYADQAHLTRECSRLAGLPARGAAGRRRRACRGQVRFLQDSRDEDPATIAA